MVMDTKILVGFLSAVILSSGAYATDDVKISKKQYDFYMKLEQEDRIKSRNALEKELDAFFPDKIVSNKYHWCIANEKGGQRASQKKLFQEQGIYGELYSKGKWNCIQLKHYENYVLDNTKK